MALSPAPTIAQRMIYSLHELHRPELANWIIYGGVKLSDKVLFIEAPPRWHTEIGSTSTRSFYEQILTLAAMRVGLPVEATWICPSSDEGSEIGRSAKK